MVSGGHSNSFDHNAIFESRSLTTNSAYALAYVEPYMHVWKACMRVSSTKAAGTEPMPSRISAFLDWQW